MIKTSSIAERGGGAAVEVHNEVSISTAKAKTTKAERRAMQEAQRAAKAATKGSNSDLIFSSSFECLD